MVWIQDTQLGPLTTKKDQNEVENLVEKTKQEGAKFYQVEKTADLIKGFFMSQQYLMM